MSEGVVVLNPQSEVTFADSANLDSFARLRVSNPKTLFDSKLTTDNGPLFWDDSEVSGTGTSSTHSVNLAASTMGVSLNTAGTRVRQTFQRFNYQPGKSQFVIFTGIFGLGANDITKRMGYFDENNGLFFELSDTTFRVVRRTSTSGSVVDNAVDQANWNLDKLDGTGNSLINLLVDKIQVYFLDFEWLGAGRIRIGVVHNGTPTYCHEFKINNIFTTVSFSNPNLPVRYEISNGGVGIASNLIQVCSSVISEGGFQKTGLLGSHSTGSSHVNANTKNIIYAVLGLRLKANSLNTTIEPESFSMISETNDDFRWLLLWNPIISGTFNYTDLNNSGLQTAVGVTANTVSDTGLILLQGYASIDTLSAAGSLETALRLGSSIAGVRDEMVLAVMPLSPGADIQAAINWRQLL